MAIESSKPAGSELGGVGPGADPGVKPGVGPGADPGFDPGAVPNSGRPGVTWRDRWQTLRTAAWLGWQVESNWTDPLLFAVYSIVKPIAAALILVVMYRIVGSDTAAELFPGMYVGNAFYMYVGALMFGASAVIIEDREYYQMLRYVYITSAGMFWYVAGRTVAKFVVTTVAVAALLVFGRFALGVSLSNVNWGMFGVVFPLGIFIAVGFGFAMAGVMLMVTRHGEAYAESVAGAFYLLCGVVFPLDVLPGWLQSVGKAIPLTYWVEAMRRAVLGEGFGQALAEYSDGALMSILAASTLATLLLAGAFFALMDRVARRKGLLDQLTSH